MTFKVAWDITTFMRARSSQPGVKRATGPLLTPLPAPTYLNPHRERPCPPQQSSGAYSALHWPSLTPHQRPDWLGRRGGEARPVGARGAAEQPGARPRTRVLSRAHRAGAGGRGARPHADQQGRPHRLRPGHPRRPAHGPARSGALLRGPRAHEGRAAGSSPHLPFFPISARLRPAPLHGGGKASEQPFQLVVPSDHCRWWTAISAATLRFSW